MPLQGVSTDTALPADTQAAQAWGRGDTPLFPPYASFVLQTQKFSEFGMQHGLIMDVRAQMLKCDLCTCRMLVALHKTRYG